MLPGLDELLLGMPRTGLSSDIRDGLERYFLMKSVGDVGDSFAGRYLGDGPLKHENLELDTAMKRKALGIPQDTEDFNDMTNLRKGSILASLGIRFDKTVGWPQESILKKRLGLSLGSVEEAIDGGRSAGRAVGGL